MTKVIISWTKFYQKNRYYHGLIQKKVLQLVPKTASILEVGSLGGELLSSLPNKIKAGVEERDDFYALARHQFPKARIYNRLSKLSNQKFDYILLTHVLSTTSDAQSLLRDIKKYCHNKTKIIVFYFNFIWKPLLDIAEKVGQKRPEMTQPNWLTQSDINNLFYLESYSSVTDDDFIIFPLSLEPISSFLNKYVSKLPIIKQFSLIHYSIFSLIQPVRDYSVSIIVPARNEEGNMVNILKKIPKLGKKTEVIFVEGNSHDNTYLTIKKTISSYKGPIKASLYKQKGRGKGDAVRMGFSKAKNDILMILDADLTVDPSELPKFYNAIRDGYGEMVMGSRLVYQMERQAMRNLNLIGNMLFSVVFSYLLNQRIKDTLCGTKVLLKSDYKEIEKNRNFFGEFDPFGDYDLIFGAAKLNLKITEIPVHYKERTYGTTNISRFSHGLLLLRMVLFAASKLKFV